jgi:hypothetical protein
MFVKKCGFMIEDDILVYMLNRVTINRLMEYLFSKFCLKFWMLMILHFNVNYTTAKYF